MTEDTAAAAPVKNPDESMEDPLIRRLHRMFTIFSDNEHCISPQQAYFIIGELSRVNGVTEQLQSSLASLIRSDTVTFHDLLRMCDLLFPDRKQFEPLVDHAFERYVQQIIFKGFLLSYSKNAKMKQCLGRKSDSKWRAYWCTVTPGAIHLWPLYKSTAVGNRKTIIMDHTSAVHIGTFDEGRFTWQITSNSKQKYQFAHFDELQQKQWMSAMDLAIERRTMEELLKHDRDCSRSTEYRTSPDKNLAWRLALECENERLMRLLDEQRRALRDEEIVRTLAARMLDEEREKREKLEEKLCILEKNLNEKHKYNVETAENIIGRMKYSGGYTNTSHASNIVVQTNNEDAEKSLMESFAN